MRILVTGSSGMIGKAVCDHLKSHKIVRLVRTKSKVASDAIYWNPIAEEIYLDNFEGFDAVIHLAGDNIASSLWTKKKKESIFLSRARDTWLLSQVFSRLHRPPKFFFSASATGFYGNRGDEVLTEESVRGRGFLSDVCVEWEGATKKAEERGIRVVHGRFGAVLSPKGGLLAKVIPPFRWGVGGKIGSGKQWLSWIALEDLVRAIEFTLQQHQLSGTFNFVSPNPVTNAAFTQQLASSLHRPAFMKMPKFALKLFFREMAEDLFLASVRAMPKRLLSSGFVFKFPTLDSYLSSDSSF
jgi:uncharacterized protein (TIGR01777 family)